MGENNTINEVMRKLQDFAGMVTLSDYGLATNYPHPADDFLNSMWDRAQSLSETQAASVRDAVDIELAAKLMRYSKRLAVLALREKNQVRIQYGLNALSLDDDQLDIRDVLRAVVLHYDVCQRHAFNFRELFDVGFRLATSSRRDEVGFQFLHGPDYGKSLEALAYSLVDTDQGPLYVDHLFD